MLVKMRDGNRMIPVEMTFNNDRIEFQFPWAPKLKDEIKIMRGAKWHGFEKENPRKIWSVDCCYRNQFNIEYLMGKNPYANWEKPLIEIDPPYKEAYSHQVTMASIIHTYHYVLLGAEMGTGKTLAMFMAALLSGIKQDDWWYVAPTPGLNAVWLEFYKWKFPLRPRMMTYDQLKKVMAEWSPGDKAPRMVTLDEISRCKTPTAQRTQVTQHLADCVRNEYGYDGYVVGMSGSPAPKNPVDWYSECEIIAPGFIKEGNWYKFRERLAFVTQNESVAGGKYTAVTGWKNDEAKCEICGNKQEHDLHDDLMEFIDGNGQKTNHAFKPCMNEVQNLYKRMKGLTHVFFKKDCLDLPEKQYIIRKCKPDQDVLNAAQIIAAQAKSAITALTLLRELSDGFQYRSVEDGFESCPDHKGQDCAICDGSGKVKKFLRTVTRVKCPKDDIIDDVMEEKEDDGRLIIYAGFTDSIDRVVDLVKKNGWDYIRVDGRGWHSSIEGIDSIGMLQIFEDRNNNKKIVFVGHPGSAGMGLTLVASDTTIYFSNTFNAEERIQSEDRNHRIGSRGCNIIDIVHLPTDIKVLENLIAKREMQAMSMGDLEFALKYTEVEAVR